MRLGIIAKAAQQICDKRRVYLRIITGGGRFYEAFFTRKNLDATYNAQRAFFADAVGLAEVVIFDDIGRYYTSNQIIEKLDAALQGYVLPRPEDAPQFKFALFNIDWYHVFGLEGSEPVVAPHGLSAPPSFISWLRELSGDQQKTLLRELLASIANDRIAVHPVGKFASDATVLTDARDWIKSVGAVSCLKYDTIGRVATREIKTTSGGPVLLTVIDKPDKPYIPTVLLLGKRAGDTVPQHVVPLLAENSISLPALYACRQ